MSRTSLVVAMLTYRRPEKLGHGLGLIVDQADELSRGPRGVDATVVIVDNDPAASARDTVGRWADRGVRYVCEPRPGIAAARNRALTEAVDADLLVFIDDDEWAEPGWLDHLVDTWQATHAAAVMGRVVSKFEHAPPPFIEAGGFFRRRRMPTGTRIPVVAAGNLLLDMGQVRASGTRFDESLGLGGGEDTLFSRVLARQGLTMVWCDESVAVDFVPDDRLTRRWVLMRAWSHGLNAGRFDVLLAEGRRARALAVARGAVGGLIRVGGGSARWVLGTLTGSLTHRARGLRALHRGRGMIAGALGRTFEEYARP